jgi:hypothetical protein
VEPEEAAEAKEENVVGITVYISCIALFSAASVLMIEIYSRSPFRLAHRRSKVREYVARPQPRRLPVGGGRQGPVGARDGGEDGGSMMEGETKSGGRQWRGAPGDGFDDEEAGVGGDGNGRSEYEEEEDDFDDDDEDDDSYEDDDEEDDEEDDESFDSELEVRRRGRASSTSSFQSSASHEEGGLATDAAAAAAAAAAATAGRGVNATRADRHQQRMPNP